MTYCRCYSCKYLLRYELKTMWTNFCVFLTDVVGLMSFVVGVDILKPELVLLAKTRIGVARVTQGSDLA